MHLTIIIIYINDFGINVNDLDNNVVNVVSKLADNRKIGGVMDRLSEITTGSR